MILSGEGIRVRYRGAPKPALDDVSCRLSAGELVAVVGPNGSGKTSLVRGLVGLVPLEHGVIRLRDRDLREWQRVDLARVVGVVAQREESLHPLRVEESVMLGRYVHLGPLEPVRARDRGAVETALRRCDAWELRGRQTDSLSGGEWQRVRVARALAQEPEVMLLDEPTASLDVRHEMEVFELVRQLVRDGLGALVITHHLNLAARYADRMLLLADGHVVAEGAASEVLRRDVVERVFGWPVAVTTWGAGVPQVVPLRPGEERFA